MKETIDIFPFQTKLSLKNLIENIETLVTKENNSRDKYISNILNQVKYYPELLQPIDPHKICDLKYRNIFLELMGLVIPPVNWERDYIVAMTPFTFKGFYCTPKFLKYFLNEDMSFKGNVNVDYETMSKIVTIISFSAILQKIYGVKFEDYIYPITATIKDPDTGLDRIFKMNIDGRFIDIVVKNKVEPLTPGQIETLRLNLTDVEVWKSIIKPENFEFHGISFLTAIEVTDQEVLSNIKKDLIESDSLDNIEKFTALRDKLRVFLRIPDLELSVAGLFPDSILKINHSLDEEDLKNVQLNYREIKLEDLRGSIFERVRDSMKYEVIDDISKIQTLHPIEKQIADLGLRSIMLIPLTYMGQLTGGMDLGSKQPGALNDYTFIKLTEVIPLFALAVKRKLDEIETKVQAVIKEKYTSIHPSVEWRFRNAAMQYLKKPVEPEGVNNEIEEIEFKEVYPLYSQADIKNSTELRNEALKKDMEYHIEFIREMLLNFKRKKDLPYLDNLLHQVDLKAEKLNNGFTANDETSINEFFKNEVYALIDYCCDLCPELDSGIRKYKLALTNENGEFFKHRNAFDSSVTKLNNAFSKLILKANEKAQDYFPHYFELHKTDGIEISMYIGESISENKKFDTLFVKNLRLWQVMIMVELSRLNENIKPKLEIPLDTTNLILVHNHPLTIKYRMDEKIFDVEGSYNIRYEIVKKRIDKVHINGTNERLTQPNKLSLVYSAPKDRAEYLEYFDYLSSIGYLDKNVEELELEELQGVSGLKALRVGIIQTGKNEVPEVPVEFEKKIKKLTSV